VGQSLVLDTSFLIDYEREVERGRPGRALAFLEANQDTRLYLTFTVAGELASGGSLSERDAWEKFLGPFYLLPSSPDVSWEYAKAFRHLEKNGRLIGANDLWIAATALAYRMPIVTSNHKDFVRVPGLDVRQY
jgi:predicted nucleic acid-binding protein